MPEWAIILVYALVFILYIAVHQMIFRFRFKECAYTVIFMDVATFVFMCINKFSSLSSWIFFATLIVTILYAGYVATMMHFLRDKIQKFVMSDIDLDSMFKNIMQGFSGGHDDSKADNQPFADDIKVTEEEPEKKDEKPKFTKEDFDDGNGVIDDDKKENDDEK